MKVFLFVLFGAVFLGQVSQAECQTFSFTSDEFRQRYNVELQKDQIDIIKQCRKSGEDLDCRFDDVRFQAGIAAMKKLNLANGRFFQKKTLLLSANKRGVYSIILGGDRSDPINLFHFIASVGALIRTLSPTLSDDQVDQTVGSLGLMRGDSDGSIGQAIDQIEDYAAIRCNNQNSAVSTKLGCVFTPRF